MLERFISVLAPHVCIVCKQEGALLCLWCKPDAIPLVPSRCYRCLAVTEDSSVCEKCRGKTALKHVWVRTHYTGAAKELVYRLKFARARAAAAEIADLLDDTLPYLPKDTVVSFIPTATSRVRIRGYDQAQLIARYFARRRGLVCKSLLLRIGQSRQVGATRALRLQQASKNYRTKRMTVWPETIVLIDDITTTGATLEAAAKQLKFAGVKQVNAAVFAQKR